MTFGQNNTRAGKLTPAIVYELRQRYVEGWTQGRLAREYQISVGQVGRIVRGEAWQQYDNPAKEITTSMKVTQRIHIPEPTKEEIAASLAKLQGMLANPVDKPLGKEEAEPKYSTLDQFLTDVKETKEGSVESKLEKFLGEER